MTEKNSNLAIPAYPYVGIRHTFYGLEGLISLLSPGWPPASSPISPLPGRGPWQGGCRLSSSSAGMRPCFRIIRYLMEKNQALAQDSRRLLVGSCGSVDVYVRACTCSSITLRVMYTHIYIYMCMRMCLHVYFRLKTTGSRVTPPNRKSRCAHGGVCADVQLIESFTLKPNKNAVLNQLSLEPGQSSGVPSWREGICSSNPQVQIGTAALVWMDKILEIAPRFRNPRMIRFPDVNTDKQWFQPWV